MTDYSFVRDEQGTVRGICVRDPKMVDNRNLLVALSLKHNLPDDVGITLLSGNFRVVPNTIDDKGGCFLLLGGD